MPSAALSRCTPVTASGEYYDPDHPLAYQHCDFSLNDSARGPHYAQDGWLTGQRMGTICSSDNHQAQPGKRQTGLAAVWAPALTRSSIFDSIHNRQTYGTTGARILLKVWVNDTFMGQETAGGNGVTVRVWAVGTDEIAWIEVLRGDLDAQRLRRGLPPRATGSRLFVYVGRSAAGC